LQLLECFMAYDDRPSVEIDASVIRAVSLPPSAAASASIFKQSRLSPAVHGNAVARRPA
jgi:hypothetical protein